MTTIPDIDSAANTAEHDVPEIVDDDLIAICRPDLGDLDEYVEVLGHIWRTQMLSNFGPVSERLERTAEARLGVAHVRATASGDSGLMATIKALDLPEGAPCFISPYTFNSTINTALWNRLRPVYVDIDEDTFNMAPERLAEAVAGEPDGGLILATHVFGAPCDVEALADIAGTRHRLVFDAAHALGSTHGGVAVGNFGDAEMFSLSGTKPVTAGEGGLIATRHDWLADRLERVRGYGFKGDYRSEVVGLNAKMSELHAALGWVNLQRLDEILARREERLARYHRHLDGVVGWQRVLPGDRSTTKDLVVILGERRAAVERALRDAAVQTKRYFVPLHYMVAYRTYATGPLPAAERAYDRSLCIPFHGALTDAQMDRVCDVITSVVSG